MIIFFGGAVYEKNESVYILIGAAFCGGMGMKQVGKAGVRLWLCTCHKETGKKRKYYTNEK